MKEFAQRLLATVGKGGPAHALGRSALHAFRREDGAWTLLVVSECRKQFPGGFEGEELRLDDGAIALCCACSAVNAAALRRHFPWCVCFAPGGERPTVAIGSWEGIPARLAAVRGTGLVPVFPPLPPGELCAADAATFEVFAAGYRDGFAVDGDRVSTAAALEKSLAEGAGFVTLTPGTVGSGNAAEYAGTRFVLNSRDAVFFTREEAERCVSRFGGVVEAAVAANAKRTAFDLGIALDGETSPTTGAAHLYVVRELRKRGIECSVLFPRYPNSPEEFRDGFRLHAAIAKVFGGYKLALPLVGIPPERFRELSRECGGMLHLEPDAAAWEQFAAYFPA